MSDVEQSGEFVGRQPAVAEGDFADGTALAHGGGAKTGRGVIAEARGLGSGEGLALLDKLFTAFAVRRDTGDAALGE